MFTRICLIAVAMAATAVAAPAGAAPASAVKAANGRVLLLLPLKLTKIDDLDFGSVVTSNAAGTVVLNPDTSARTFLGGVTGIPSAAGQRAYFGGGGTPNQQVVVVVVPPLQLTSSNGDKITVLALTLDKNGNPLRTIDPVTKTFFVGVGGILAIGANQPDGLYSATFQVTANYL